MAIISVFLSRNSLYVEQNCPNCLRQKGQVNPRNNARTINFPRKSERLIAVPLTSGNVKFGASAPIFRLDNLFFRYHN